MVATQDISNRATVEPPPEGIKDMEVQGKTKSAAEKIILAMFISDRPKTFNQSIHLATPEVHECLTFFMFFLAIIISNKLSSELGFSLSDSISFFRFSFFLILSYETDLKNAQKKHIFFWILNPRQLCFADQSIQA